MTLTKYIFIIALTACFSTTAKANLNHDITMNEADILIQVGKKMGKEFFRLSETELRNFNSKVNKSGPIPDQSNPHYLGLEACWEWMGCRNSCGYGLVRLRRKTILSHRINYVSEIGMIPDGLKVLHRCDNPACVNPDHLFLGTQKDNAADRMKKGRNGPRPGWRNSTRNHPVGEEHHKAKLNSFQVLEIRRLMDNGSSAKELAVSYGVSAGTIYFIHNRTNWKHLK